MNFQHLRFAIAVAQTGSFTRAADACCVTQPALSNAIGQLEEELGGRLFERTTRSVTLTAFGTLMIEKMEQIVAARLDLLTSASDYLTRDDKLIRIGQSPLISADFSQSMLSRARQFQLDLVLTEMNKADIGPALQSGTIDVGLCPAPQNSTTLKSAPIYTEPLFVVSDQKNQTPTGSSKLTDIAGQKILLVPDDCGLSDTVRFLFQDQKLTMDEYEGRALAYHVLEKWAHLGIGATVLPASQVTRTDYARPLKTTDDTFASIQFEAHWMARQETRSSFDALMACLGTSR
ncbi:LysR family transcriptional regulator [Cohaesibacter gelatinilyticus]|uniref:DNA-binding transcriptional regulator, LysR family n=1 Tax=Cohaesibacter gelatinilyticus TaxID=372072 RepID=A0A285PBQ7_9HYPH|nr:LysR family transcriptional regulator [Cohaesibacter gelatinilyticus]SNZ19190.1 DNA-binding transcriptional regulator, LysR family [Cohaesibacter gelatinilyticus]